MSAPLKTCYNGAPTLNQEQILAWADAFFAATGKWPNKDSGPIEGAEETWNAIADAMQRGGRGLRRRLTLPQLLAERRGCETTKVVLP